MPVYNWRITMSYDADKDFYEPGNELRIGFIKFLLQNNAYRIRAYVATTVAFSCRMEKEKVFPFWRKAIKDEFGDEFYYHISVLRQTVVPNRDFAMIKKSKTDFESNFNDDVKTAKKQLKDAGISYNDN